MDMQEGMQWDKGYASPFFITDPEEHTATIESTPVFITDFPLNSMAEIMPLLKDLIETRHILNFTIIAPEFGGDVLPSLIANKYQNKFMAICVKAPGTGEQQTDMLQDMAILTGATFISAQLGHKLEDVRFVPIVTGKQIGRAHV